MDLAKTLASLDQMLTPGPKLTPMTKAQFEGYVQDQLAKAKAEMDEDADEAKKPAAPGAPPPPGAGKAKKRLAHLQKTMHALTKAEGTPLVGAWTGDNGTALIPEYDYGFEDTTRKTEVSETEFPTPPAGNTGTQGDGGPFSNGEPSYAQPPQPFAAAGTTVPGSGAGTQTDNSIFAQGDAVIGKNLSEIAKMLGSVQPPKAPPAAPVKKADAFNWPKDLADGEYIKEGVNKRAPDHWGGDTETSAK